MRLRCAPRHGSSWRPSRFFSRLVRFWRGHSGSAARGWIDASDVDVRVSEGEVTLIGTVESRRDKRLLEDMIDDVSGVRDVHNQVRVRREPGARDAAETRSRTS